MACGYKKSEYLIQDGRPSVHFWPFWAYWEIIHLKNNCFSPSMTFFVTYRPTMFFFMFLIDCFLLNLNPMSVSLKSLIIFLNSMSKVSISRSNMIFQQMKLETSVILQFYVIFTLLSIFENILVIQGHIQGQKVNFKFKSKAISFSIRKVRKMCNTCTSISCDFDWAIYFWNYFNYIRSSSRSKGQFQGYLRENILFLTSKAMNVCNNTSFSWDFDREIHS